MDAKKTENCMICGEDECHASDSIKIITQFCLSSKSKNHMEMAMTIMKHPVIPMHGPEHHAMIAAVLVTAYKNQTGKATYDDIKKAICRGASVPGGYCGLFGADGAAICLRDRSFNDHESHASFVSHC